MGITYVEGVVTGPTGKQATVRFLDDSGATYTLLPYDVSQMLGLTPKRTVTFSLADGSTVDRVVWNAIWRFRKERGILLSSWVNQGITPFWEW